MAINRKFQSTPVIADGRIEDALVLGAGHGLVSIHARHC